MLLAGEYGPLEKRGIDEKTCAKFRYKIGKDERGNGVQIATYCDKDGRPVAQKIRYPDKKFRWVGEPKRAVLFGQHLWNGGRRIVVTEGEIDALSMAQALNLKWPVVSVPNGAGGAKKDLAEHIEFLEIFDAVIFMFDNDEPGQEAAIECAELLTPGKAYVAHLPLKDANEMLLAKRSTELVSCAWEAKVYRPDGIVLGETLWEKVSEEPEQGLGYPWPCLDKLLYGMRVRELVTWTGGTGTGKSSLIREVAHHIATFHQQRVGIIALEESVRRAALCQMSLAANRQLHLPPVRAVTSDKEMREAFDATMGTKRFVFYDHFGTVEASSLLPRIRYMVLALKIKWVFLDHISIMVSGMATEGDERKRIDELMTKLRQLVEELDFGLHIVSHLRKTSGTPHEEGGRISLADLRGSGAIAQVSDAVIGAERDQQGEGGDNYRILLRALKNRFSGDTGTAGTLMWIPKTGRLVEEGAAALVNAPTGGQDAEGDF